MDRNCLIGFITLSGVILGIVAMFLDYRAKMNKKGVELEKRTHELEKKNGKELAELEKLNQRIKELEQKLTKHETKY